MTCYRNLQMLLWPMYLGLVFFTDISCHKTDSSLIPCASLFLRLSPFPHPQVSRYGNWTVVSYVCSRYSTLCATVPSVHWTTIVVCSCSTFFHLCSWYIVLLTPEFEPRTVQRVARRYTDRAILANLFIIHQSLTKLQIPSQIVEIQNCHMRQNIKTNTAKRGYNDIV
jgi:hypothetical protein